MRLLLRLESGQNDRAIRYILFRQSPKTREEAIANIREAIGLCLEVRVEREMPLAMETLQLEIAA
uniref:Uncharacterized protein n=1 Tax=Candidatus Kentrum sp. FM TaxID=2126340 RepID=A0A450TN27_9GAMM|nr:MAG: hypothetical protein BECKFM1743C_GA0114222_105126 [Candidatus Kentron sp. FM]VFJ72068.1 MAG: hypothetical protein BECKFM1743A_GA0114220_106216 [Candidatus Kentron sp. FM]VFK20247.1 MAG: hypothetical protein BECKFM1743B_GA0114221_106811 [Candidatus Kentron sp. FM]